DHAGPARARDCEGMTRMWGRLRAAGMGLVGVLLLAAVWALYKAFGPTDGLRVGERLLVLPRSTDLAMPHSWEMIQRLFEPATGAPGAPSAIGAVAEASLFTLGIATRGWFFGVVVGLLLALLMNRFRLAESGLLPWI